MGYDGARFLRGLLFAGLAIVVLEGVSVSVDVSIPLLAAIGLLVAGGLGLRSLLAHDRRVRGR